MSAPLFPQAGEVYQSGPFFWHTSGVFGLSGSLDRLFLSDLFEWLALTRATGRLMLSAGPVTRSFDVVGGKVAFVSSSRAAERFASWLLRKQLAPRDALLMALATSQTRGESFTVVVERDAGVSRETLTEAARSLATALVSRLLREERVIFRFDPAWPVTANLHINLELEFSKLIMQAAYTVDTQPPRVEPPAPALDALNGEALEGLFWRVVEGLEGEMVEAPAVAVAHRTFVAVGEVLHRWVTVGPPLLPIGPADVERVRACLAEGRPVSLEDSPTMVWDLLCLVNSLDAPGFSRAGSASEAWLMAGANAAGIVSLVLESPRWRRPSRGEADTTLRRAALARGAAGLCLGEAVGLAGDVAATAAALPVVLLEIVATALASAQLASPAMQQGALRELLPIVGRTAATAAGLPEVLVAALTGSPPEHPGARVVALAAAAAGDAGIALAEPVPVAESSVSLNEAMNAARQAVARAALAEG